MLYYNKYIKYKTKYTQTKYRTKYYNLLSHDTFDAIDDSVYILKLENPIGGRLGNNLFDYIRYLITIFLNARAIQDVGINKILIAAPYPILSFEYIYDQKIINHTQLILIEHLKEYQYKFLDLLKSESDVLYKYYSSIILLYTLHNIEIYKFIQPILYNYFTNFIESKIIEKKSDICDICLHIRMSDFCSSNKNYRNTLDGNEGAIYLYPILSFNYYYNCLDQIIANNPDHIYRLIIFYYKTPIDELVINYFINTLKIRYENKKLIIITEYEYTKADNELSLIYDASLCDYIILSNSTFAFWIYYFRMLRSNEPNKIYYPKYPLYNSLIEVIPLLLNTALYNDIIINYDTDYNKALEKLQINDIITYNSVTSSYFICLNKIIENKDLVRLIFASIEYFRSKLNLDWFEETELKPIINPYIANYKFYTDDLNITLLNILIKLKESEVYDNLLNNYLINKLSYTDYTYDSYLKFYYNVLYNYYPKLYAKIRPCEDFIDHNIPALINNFLLLLVPYQAQASIIEGEVRRW